MPSKEGGLVAPWLRSSSSPPETDALHKFMFQVQCARDLELQQLRLVNGFLHEQIEAVEVIETRLLRKAMGA